jgi:threonine synthase
LAESNGIAIAVDDLEIIEAVRKLASRFGIFVEPSSAAGFAAFERLLRRGAIGAGQRVVFIATGTGLKDLRPILHPDCLKRIREIAPEHWLDIALACDRLILRRE